MRLKQRIYAMLLVVVYMTSTLLSSLSMLSCDHNHHHDHIHHHHTSCSCRGLTIAEECCNHSHGVADDTHTQYIVSELRSDSRTAQLITLLLTPAIVPVMSGEFSPVQCSILECDFGDIFAPLRAAFIPRETLRAPPALV